MHGICKTNCRRRIKKKSLKEPCWFEIIDILSKEYGWTIDHILTMTMLQVDQLLKSIFKRHDAELRLQASLHGVQLKKSASEEVKPLSKDQFNACKNALKEKLNVKR